ncbi:hypothetical protein CRE_24365, partial [Caenorhabditis remanei]
MSASREIPQARVPLGSVEHDHPIPRETRGLGARPRVRQQRRDGEQQARARILQLPGEILGRRQRRHGRDHGSRPQDPVERSDERRHVRCVQRHHVSHPDAAGGEAARDRQDLAAQLGVARLGAARPVDQGHPPELRLGQSAEHGLGDGNIRDLDLPIGTAERHVVSFDSSRSSSAMRPPRATVPIRFRGPAPTAMAPVGGSLELSPIEPSAEEPQPSQPPSRQRHRRPHREGRGRSGACPGAVARLRRHRLVDRGLHGHAVLEFLRLRDVARFDRAVALRSARRRGSRCDALPHVRRARVARRSVPRPHPAAPGAAGRSARARHPRSARHRAAARDGARALARARGLLLRQRAQHQPHPHGAARRQSRGLVGALGHGAVGRLSAGRARSDPVRARPRAHRRLAAAARHQAARLGHRDHGRHRGARHPAPSSIEREPAALFGADLARSLLAGAVRPATAQDQEHRARTEQDRGRDPEQGEVLAAGHGQGSAGLARCSARGLGRGRSTSSGGRSGVRAVGAGSTGIGGAGRPGVGAAVRTSTGSGPGARVPVRTGVRTFARTRGPIRTSTSTGTSTGPGTCVRTRISARHRDRQFGDGLTVTQRHDGVGAGRSVRGHGHPLRERAVLVGGRRADGHRRGVQLERELLVGCEARSGDPDAAAGLHRDRRSRVAPGHRQLRHGRLLGLGRQRDVDVLRLPGGPAGPEVVGGDAQAILVESDAQADRIGAADRGLVPIAARAVLGRHGRRVDDRRAGGGARIEALLDRPVVELGRPVGVRGEHGHVRVLREQRLDALGVGAVIALVELGVGARDGVVEHVVRHEQHRLALRFPVGEALAQPGELLIGEVDERPSAPVVHVALAAEPQQRQLSVDELLAPEAALAADLAHARLVEEPLHVGGNAVGSVVLVVADGGDAGGVVLPTAGVEGGEVVVVLRRGAVARQVAVGDDGVGPG